MSEQTKEPWENEFDAQFKDDLFTHAEDRDYYYTATDRVKAFIRYQLKKKRYIEEKESAKLRHQLSQEDQYTYERGTLFHQATTTVNLMATLVKQYLESHHPGLEFRIEALVPNRYDVDNTVILIDTFELALDVTFPSLSINESVKLLREVESYIIRHGMGNISRFAIIKVFSSEEKDVT